MGFDVRSIKKRLNRKSYLESRNRNFSKIIDSIYKEKKFLYVYQILRRGSRYRELVNQCTPRIKKNVVENVLFAKSSYETVPVFVNYRDRPMNGPGKIVKSTLFRISSFTKQKYEVTIIQQNLSSILNEYLPEWLI